MLRSTTLAEERKAKKEAILRKRMTISEESFIKKNFFGSSKKIVTEKVKLPEIEKEEENTSDISFSISGNSDINDLCDKMSNISNDKFDFVYEGNTKDIAKELNDYIDESLKKFIKDKKGFEDDIKVMSQTLYKELCGIAPDVKNNRVPTNDKSKTNLFTECPSVSRVEQETRLRNDLSGVPIMIQPDITHNGDKNSKTSKAKDSEENNKITNSSREKSSSKKDLISSGTNKEENKNENQVTIKTNRKSSSKRELGAASSKKMNNTGKKKVKDITDSNDNFEANDDDERNLIQESKSGKSGKNDSNIE